MLKNGMLEQHLRAIEIAKVIDRMAFHLPEGAIEGAGWEMRRDHAIKKAYEILAMPQVFDPMRDVEEFHRKFGLTYHGPPRALTGELGAFRRQFLSEENEEYADSSKFLEDHLQESDDASVTYELEKQLDALVDLVYVAIGTAYLHGFNFREAWRRVQTANMAKVRAERAEDSKRGTTFDVIKPKGWVAPNHSDLVEGHAHRSTPC